MNNTQGNNSSKVGPLIVGALGLVYGVSPIDVVPDILPVLGWLDDLVITGGAILHVAEAYLKDYSSALASMVKMIKWMVWLLGGIFVLVLALFGMAIYSLFT